MSFRKLLTAFVLAASFVATPAYRASADVDVDIHVGVPAPPVVGFIAQPDVVIVPDTRVFYAPTVKEYDMYRIGTDWYINRDGYWYRSNSFRGPFAFVDASHVPRHLVVVPREYGHQPRKPHKGKKSRKHRDHGDDD